MSTVDKEHDTLSLRAPSAVPSFDKSSYGTADTEAGGQAEEKVAAPKKPRNMAWDNAKLILTIFVCTGHIIMFFGPQLWGHAPHDACVAFWVWFHLFEMPGFVFISGYFSRSFAGFDGTIITIHEVKLRNTLVKIFFVYINWILFEHAFYSMDKLVMQDKQWWNPSKYFDHFFNAGVDAVPQPWFKVLNGEWYLMALFFWRQATPYMHTIREPVLVAFAACWISGWVSWPESSVFERLFGYFPFFVMGLVAEEQYMQWLKVKAIQIPCTIILFGSLPLVWWQLDHFFNVSWVTLSFHESTKHPWLKPEFYLCCIVMTFSFFAFIHMTMSNVTVFARASQATLYNYLIHLPLLHFLAWFWDWRPLFKGLDPLYQCAFAYAMAVAVAVLTTSPVFTYLFSPLISPDCKWLFKAQALPSMEDCCKCSDAGLVGCTGACSQVCTGMGKCHKGVDSCFSSFMNRVAQCMGYQDTKDNTGYQRVAQAGTDEPGEAELMPDSRAMEEKLMPAHPRKSIM